MVTLLRSQPCGDGSLRKQTDRSNGSGLLREASRDQDFAREADDSEVSPEARSPTSPWPSSVGPLHHRSWRADPTSPGGYGGDSWRQEATTQHALGNPFTIQVGRDAAEVERPASSEDQAEVDIHRRSDDFFSQHQANLLCQRIQRPLPHLLLGVRLVAYNE